MATTVVAVTYDVLPEFDPDRDSVKSYTARAKIFFKANSIVEEKQAPIFLSCIGARTYDLLESLLAPTTLDEATFETCTGQDAGGAFPAEAEFDQKAIRFQPKCSATN